MTVRELKEILENCPEDFIIVLSSDAEGNSYSKLESCNIDEYNFDDDHICLKVLTKELISLGYTEDDLGSGTPCVVLWP